MKASRITPQFADRIPKTLEDGILYISEKYSTAVHNCCCGCGGKVVTPLKEGRWTLTKNKRGISLSPSIGNWSLACKSHYWIENNGVRWAAKFSAAQIKANRLHDKKALEAAHAERRTVERPLWEKFRDWVQSFFSRH